jgi:sugar O-acyltransferase (sialic acid O-acetyltransferase NeuD family)
MYAVYGASGFGREVMPLARAMLERELAVGDFCLVFVDDGAPPSASMNGHAVMTYEQFLATPAENRHVCIAIASASVREEISLRCQRDGVLPFSVVSETAVFLDANEIGEGAVFCSFSHVTSNARIGRYFHANIYSYVAHDCVVGDFVTLAPGAKVNGNVTIEDGAYIGTGAIIKQGAPGKPTVVGKGAVVGMGAVVTKSVAPGAVVVGNPAKPMGT